MILIYCSTNVTGFICTHFQHILLVVGVGYGRGLFVPPGHPFGATHTRGIFPTRKRSPWQYWLGITKPKSAFSTILKASNKLLQNLKNIYSMEFSTD